MANLNGKGPREEGPMTGRGMGKCRGNGTRRVNNRQPVVVESDDREDEIVPENEFYRQMRRRRGPGCGMRHRRGHGGMQNRRGNGGMQNRRGNCFGNGNGRR